MKKNGYTMVELLVVLAIIMLMLAIVVPQFSFSQKGAGLKGSSSQIMSALRAARRLAIKEITLHAVAFDIYSIPSRFGILRHTALPSDSPSDSDYWYKWELVGEFERLPQNIAIVAINQPSDTSFNVTRTDDLDLDGVEDVESTALIYNPQVIPPGFSGAGTPGPNGITNLVFRLVKFQPTGAADSAIIYLWNTTEDRNELPNPTVGQMLSNLHALGVPPGLQLDPSNNQQTFFRLPNQASIADVYYYTLVVNPITGGITVYDYAWGEGGGTAPNKQWDRKKDGET